MASKRSSRAVIMWREGAVSAKGVWVTGREDGTDHGSRGVPSAAPACAPPADAFAERQKEFREFLATDGFPAPLFNAHLSAWAQFICGLLIAAGAATRPAAAVMAINFAVALWMVHRSLPFSANIAPLAMFFGSLLLVFHGAGAYSVDAALQRRANPLVRAQPAVE